MPRIRQYLSRLRKGRRIAFHFLLKNLGRFFLSAALWAIAGISLSCRAHDPQNTVDRNARTYYFQGLAAYERQDYLHFHESAEKAVELSPDNPGLLYALARANALLGRKQQSVECLKKAVDLGFYFNAPNTDFNQDEDRDFRSIKDSEAYKAILSDIDKANISIHNSRVAFAILEKDLMPEGIAYDPVEKAFYLGSASKRKIVAVDGKDGIKDFVNEGEDGLWSVWGMKVDAERRILWAVSSPWHGMKNYRARDFGQSAVFKYSLIDKKFIKKYLLDERPILHDFNDLVINASGDVFVTDSEHNAVYTIPVKTDNLKLFLKPLDAFTYPNGIALSDDEKYLYVSHLEGVSAVEMTTRSRALLFCPEGVTMCGIDGLYFYRKSLIGVQNGLRPARVVRFFLDAAPGQVIGAEILESNNPLFALPTTGAFAGREFYYIADSQLNSYTRDLKIFPPDRLRDIVVLRIPILDETAPLRPAGLFQRSHRS